MAASPKSVATEGTEEEHLNRHVQPVHSVLVAPAGRSKARQRAGRGGAATQCRRGTPRCVLRRRILAQPRRSWVGRQTVRPSSCVGHWPLTSWPVVCGQTVNSGIIAAHVEDQA